MYKDCLVLKWHESCSFWPQIWVGKIDVHPEKLVRQLCLEAVCQDPVNFQKKPWGVHFWNELGK
jgi:hypothetical protein